MIDSSSQAERLPTVPVVKKLVAGWRLGGYGYVDMWVLEKK